MLSFILLAILAQASPVKCGNPLQQKMNIIILAGQSNMAGRGGVLNDTATGITAWDGVVPPECQPNPSIFRLSANLTWVEALEPLHADIDYNKTNGIGPGMPFINAVLGKNPKFGVVGLVPRAQDFKSRSQCQKGELLYKQLVKRAQAAVKSGGVYRAMLWYQGESDTENKQDADFYKGRLERFFHDLRSDLQTPTLPVFQLGISGQIAEIMLWGGGANSQYRPHPKLFSHLGPNLKTPRVYSVFRPMDKTPECTASSGQCIRLHECTASSGYAETGWWLNGKHMSTINIPR
ncbi:probable carbohydrate esterase At4g34215 [Hibiscus syriacus]|uniref:probable carbohydrate esterase At4g34215 n=1 Tax=Hibiscus syriacus TaxID=106335 RepID=UPI00192276E8|nr:probable carbohydrate esterase At4g34215 [Hibiscus syriacus]